MVVIKHKSFHSGLQEAQLHKWTLACFLIVFKYIDTCPISPEVFISSWFYCLKNFINCLKSFSGEDSLLMSRPQSYISWSGLYSKYHKKEIKMIVVHNVTVLAILCQISCVCVRTHTCVCVHVYVIICAH